MEATGEGIEFGCSLAELVLRSSDSVEITSNGDAIMNRLRNLLDKAEQEHNAAVTIADKADQFGLSFGPVGCPAVSTALNRMGKIWLSDDGAEQEKDECEVLMVEAMMLEANAPRRKIENQAPEEEEEIDYRLTPEEDAMRQKQKRERRERREKEHESAALLQGSMTMARQKLGEYLVYLFFARNVIFFLLEMSCFR